MTFKEAKDELKRLAKGRYHSIEYDLTEYSNGKLEAGCRLYIDPKISVRASTWSEGLSMMKEKLEMEFGQTECLSEIPGEELGSGKDQL